MTNSIKQQFPDVIPPPHESYVKSNLDFEDFHTICQQLCQEVENCIWVLPDYFATYVSHKKFVHTSYCNAGWSCSCLNFRQFSVLSKQFQCWYIKYLLFNINPAVLQARATQDIEADHIILNNNTINNSFSHNDNITNLDVDDDNDDDDDDYITSDNESDSDEEDIEIQKKFIESRNKTNNYCSRRKL